MGARNTSSSGCDRRISLSVTSTAAEARASDRNSSSAERISLSSSTTVAPDGQDRSCSSENNGSTAEDAYRQSEHTTRSAKHCAAAPPDEGEGEDTGS